MTTSSNLETAAAAEAIPLESDPEQLALRSGPHWDSFEQFRMGGPKQLEAGLGRGQVGELRVKGRDYVIMERETFNQLYGLAQDIRRLRHAMVLVRQAAQLVLHTSGARMAIEHLRDLTAYLPGPAPSAPRRRANWRLTRTSARTMSRARAPGKSRASSSIPAESGDRRSRCRNRR